MARDTRPEAYFFFFFFFFFFFKKKKINLEDDDLLEMVNAGLIPAIVVDDFLADFWKKVFTQLTVHDDVAVRTGARLPSPSGRTAAELA